MSSVRGILGERAVVCIVGSSINPHPPLHTICTCQSRNSLWNPFWKYWQICPPLILFPSLSEVVGSDSHTNSLEVGVGGLGTNFWVTSPYPGSLPPKNYPHPTHQLTHNPTVTSSFSSMVMMGGQYFVLYRGLCPPNRCGISASPPHHCHHKKLKNSKCIWRLPFSCWLLCVNLTPPPPCWCYV